MITVVITNFKRPTFLMEAFQSCVAAGVKNIVISSSGEDNEVVSVHRRILAQQPETIITSIKSDLGCNETWLRGVKKVKTPWTHILHDDDRLLPRFQTLKKYLYEETPVLGVVSPQSPKPRKKPDRDIGFLHWDCARHGPLSPSPFKHSYFPGLAEGIYPAGVMASIVADKRYNSVSPVAGLFRTEHVLETLEECEHNFGANFMWRKNMMVGNDLMLWLRAVEKYKIYRFFTTPMVSYGYWSGSTSCIDVGAPTLLPIYNRTREYWQKHPLKK